jgi:hypothetical protein
MKRAGNNATPFIQSGFRRMNQFKKGRVLNERTLQN